MCDKCDTSSFNEEWERVTDSSNESKYEMDRMKEEVEKMKIEMEMKDEDIRKIREENEAEVAILRSKVEENLINEVERMKEELKKKDEEIAMLRTKGATFSMEEWMMIQSESMKVSSVNLNQETMELYKKIWEKGVARAQSTSASERKILTEQIQEMEGLCEEISNNVLKNTEANIKKIRDLLQNEETAKTGKEINNAAIKNLPIEKFLGTYTLGENRCLPNLRIERDGETYTWRTMIMRKANAEGLFETLWICDNGKVGILSWIPDNVVRYGHRVWIEGNVLCRSSDDHVSRYELTDNGFIANGFLPFNRV